MPIDRRFYPENWDEIALQVKEEVDWTCENCQRPCMRPGEELIAFLERVAPMTPNQTRDNTWGIEDKEGNLKLGRFVLTVAHLDQDSSKNDRSNLKALCSPCHLKHDRPFRQQNRMRKRERNGQINYLTGVNMPRPEPPDDMPAVRAI